MNKQLTVIGTNHGKNVSRIWIEGRRLTNAGFVVGARYHRERIRLHDNEDVTGPDYIRLTLSREGKYKVSGKGDKPVIDISGGIVREVFPASGEDTSRQMVEVIYEKGVITIQQPIP